MSQNLSSQYKQIFIQFYSLVSKRHHDRGRQVGKLQKLMQHIEESTNAPSSFKIHKKISEETDCSLVGSKQSRFADLKKGKQQNELFFTFKPNSQLLNSCQTVNLKYQNLSIYKVILYSILFNNLYLQALSQRTTIKISDVYNLNKKNISRVQQVVTQMQRGQQYQGKNSRVQCFRNIIDCLRWDSRSQDKVFQDLGCFIDSLVHQIPQQIFSRLINQNQQNSLLSSSCHNFQRNRLGSQKSFNDDLKVLELISKQLKIRIKLEINEQKFVWGSSKNVICFSIKKSPNTNNFSLRQISYYKKKAQHIQRRREKYKQIMVRSNCLEV